MPMELALPTPVEGAGLLLTAIESFSKVQAAIVLWACAADVEAAINAAKERIFCFFIFSYYACDSTGCKLIISAPGSFYCAHLPRGMFQIKGRPGYNCVTLSAFGAIVISTLASLQSAPNRRCKLAGWSAGNWLAVLKRQFRDA